MRTAASWGFAMKRTVRDQQIQRALALKVRYFSLRQIAECWWPDAKQPEVLAQRGLRQLVLDGLIERLTPMTGPMLDLAAPLLSWHQGQLDPDFGAVSWRLQSRWPQVPLTPTTIYRNSARTNSMYGGPDDPKAVKIDQVTHDLHVSAVYLHFLRHRPDEAEFWVGEDLRPKSGFRLKDPDAILERPDGSLHVVEFGGKYDTDRFRAFHVDCAKRGRSYELW